MDNNAEEHQAAQGRNRTRRDSRFRWAYPWGLFALILIGALAARLHNLGTFSFWTDELYHVVAAQSVVETGSPTLPSYTDGEYTRAYPVTYLTALAFEWFGTSEAAGRAPFLLVNMAFLVVAFLVLRRWFNVHLALIVTFVLAFSPHELRLGREVRMYGMLQLLYFGAAALFFEGFECGRHAAALRGERGPRRWWVSWSCQVLLLGSSCALFLLAYRVHPLAVNFPFALVPYCLAMTLAVAHSEGPRALLASRYSLLLMLIAGVGLGVFIGAPSLVERLIAQARERPAWETTGDGFSYYFWFFSYYYPALALVYMLGVVLLIRRFGRSGLFILCSFVPLMAAHVWLFTGRVDMRYIFYILPYFFIGACFAVEGALRQALRLVARDWQGGSWLVASCLFVAILPAFSLFAHTWIGESRDMLRWGYGPNWKSVSPELRGLEDQCVVMTPWPFHVAHYSGEFPDYILRKEQTEDGDESVGQLGARSVTVRWVHDAEEFERRLDRHADVCVVMTEWALTNDAYLDEPMREVMTRRLVPMEHDGDTKVQLYRKAR